MGLKLYQSGGIPAVTDAKYYETTSALSLSGSVNVNADDWVLASITTRSATTFSSGWTVLYEGAAFESSNNQRISLICKKATSGGSLSLTVTQASSARIYINLLSIGNIGGFEYVAGLKATSPTAVSSISVPNKVSGEKLIWTCSAPLWATAAPYGYWTTSPADLIRYSIPDTSIQPRQASFLDLGSGQATSRTFIPIASSPCEVVAVGLLGGNYNESGSALYGPYDLSSAELHVDSDISWTATIPNGTTLSVKTAVRNDSTTPASEEFVATISGQPIPNLTNEQNVSSAKLWIKVEMTTSDTTVTPELMVMSWYVVNAVDPSRIKISLTDAGRLKHPQGLVTVNFTGSMSGAGGSAVAPFTMTFTPANITPTFNPNDAERMSITPTITALLKRIYYEEYQAGNERMSITPVITTALIHINDLET